MALIVLVVSFSINKSLGNGSRCLPAGRFFPENLLKSSKKIIVANSESI